MYSDIPLIYNNRETDQTEIKLYINKVLQKMNIAHSKFCSLSVRTS